MHPASQPASMPQCLSAPAWLVLWLPPSSSWLKLIIIVIKYQLFIRHRNSSYQGVPPHRLPLCGKEEEKAKRKGVELTRQFSSEPVLLVFNAYQIDKFLQQQQQEARNVTVYDMEPGELYICIFSYQYLYIF